MPNNLVINLLIILGAGLLAGIISKRLNIPMVIGYLLAGALIGPGGWFDKSQNASRAYFLLPQFEKVGKEKAPSLYIFLLPSPYLKKIKSKVRLRIFRDGLCLQADQH